MANTALQEIRQVNEHLKESLARLQPEQTNCVAIKSQDFSDLLGVLLRGANCMLNLPPDVSHSSEIEKERAEYRGNLERLKQFLPYLHGCLLAQKARLENAQLHLAAAAAWAGASKKSL